MYYSYIMLFTGHLDRVVHGLTAEDILNNCDENAMPTDVLINPSVTLSQALKRRNLATFKNLAQQKLQTPGGNIPVQQMNQSAKNQSYAMDLTGVRTNVRDPDAHIIFFDTEALIGRFTNEPLNAFIDGLPVSAFSCKDLTSLYIDLKSFGQIHS